MYFKICKWNNLKYVSIQVPNVSDIGSYEFLGYLLFIFTAIDQELVWYLKSHAVWLARCACEDDQLVGPCMVGCGASWCYCMGLLVTHF